MAYVVVILLGLLPFVYFVLGIMYIIDGNTAGDGWSMVILSSLFIFCEIIFIKSNSKTLEQKKEIRKKWIESICGQYNIDCSEIKITVQDSYDGKYFLYTNDKRLYLINENTQYIKQIDLMKILSLDITAKVVEKNTQQIVSLTKTFQNHKKVTSYNLKVFTEDETISFEFQPNIIIKDELERFKLLLEKDIQTISN